MAQFIVDLALLLGDMVADILAAEAAEEATVEALTAVEEALQTAGSDLSETALSTYQKAIEAGEVAEEAESRIINVVFNEIADRDPEAARQFVRRVQAKYDYVPRMVNPGNPTVVYDAIEDDIIPNMADIAEGTRQDQKSLCSIAPQSPTCLQTKADNVGRYIDSQIEDDTTTTAASAEQAVDDEAIDAAREAADAARQAGRSADEAAQAAKDAAQAVRDAAKGKEMTTWQKVVVLAKGVVTLAALAALGFSLFGVVAVQIAEALCNMRGTCKKDANGTCGACQKYDCDCSKYVQPESCSAINGFIQWIRKYYLVIMVVLAFVGISLTIYLRSGGIAIASLIIGIVLTMLSSWVGNMIATVTCGAQAATCFVTHGTTRC